ncbi:MAG: metallophosphoesterase [Deltaproteobacteria bacterium]|jgi:UDP-2,3-diacylglucosamine pyrophosphatase LpxH
MLVFISDLHFVDGSAEEHNLSRALEYFFEDLVSIAQKPSNNIQEIKIVLLGDIFDMLRTEHWFGYPADERPWGLNEHAVEVHAQMLFDAIVDYNEKQEDKITHEERQTFTKFQQWLKELPDRCQQDINVRLFYLPGNHDRLLNRYQSLREKVCALLGIPPEWHDPKEPFPNTYEDLAYGVFARHGHEYDKYNYEGGVAYTPKDYQLVPIGDPITTELVARLPYTLAQRLKTVGWLTDEEKSKIRRNFQEIENVRPLSATIEWLLYQVRQDRRLKDIIEDTVQEIIDHFESLDFVKGWYARHDKWTDWRDEADKIQAFLFLLRNFKLYRTEKLWDLAMRARDYFTQDDLLLAAPQEYIHLDPRIRYVVYGHTHDPLLSAVRSTPGTPYPFDQVYLNTGTWRGRFFQTTQGDAFISWKNMTYVIFYRQGERDNPYPVFETWTGSLKTV